MGSGSDLSALIRWLYGSRRSGSVSTTSTPAKRSTSYDGYESDVPLVDNIVALKLSTLWDLVKASSVPWLPHGRVTACT